VPALDALAAFDLLAAVANKLRLGPHVPLLLQVPLTSTIMMRAAMTAAERKQQHEESMAQKASRGIDMASISSAELHARPESSGQEQHTFV
jgi:hypothetical protein